jgi:hypothetical protein
MRRKMRRRRQEWGRLHLGKVDAAPGEGGTQARWAGKGRKETQ